MVRSTRSTQRRLRDIISPVLRPALWSTALGAAVAFAFAAPAYADPTLPNAVPDAGSRPQYAGALVLPGAVPTSSAPVVTTPTALTGPLATQVFSLETEVATLGDQLLGLQQSRDTALTDRSRAQESLTAATAALSRAESAAESAAADALKEAAALPPGAFGSDLHGLGSLSRIQEGKQQAADLTGPAGEISRARTAVGQAQAALDEADRNSTTATTAFTAAQAHYHERETALVALRKQNAAQLVAIEQAQEAVDQQVGAAAGYGNAANVAGMAADPRALGAVQYALAQLGDPYVWSAEGPDQYDCSGLMWASYRSVGYQLPRVAKDQYYATRQRAVDPSALLPGDLIFFASDSRDWRTVHHVAMYIGNGKMVHAPNTGDVVKVSTVWWSRFYAATRVFGAVPAPAASTPGAQQPSAPKPPAPKPPAPKPTPTTPEPTPSPTTPKPRPTTRVPTTAPGVPRTTAPSTPTATPTPMTTAPGSPTGPAPTDSGSATPSALASNSEPTASASGSGSATPSS